MELTSHQHDLLVSALALAVEKEVAAFDAGSPGEQAQIAETLKHLQWLQTKISEARGVYIFSRKAKPEHKRHAELDRIFIP